MDVVDMVFLGNPNSPHLNQWVRLLNEGGYNVKVIAHTKTGHPSIADSYDYVLPAWFNIFPQVILYIVAGFLLRLRGGLGCVHAHNTSGYGVMAYLSGANYIVTTYGSEIYAVPKKSWFYKFLIGRVVRGAVAITTTSPQMTSVLKSIFPDVASKIHEFSLGFDRDFYYSEDDRVALRSDLGISLDEFVWIINRRVHPLYRTEEIIKAFLRFSGSNKRHRLLVMQGDCDSDYYRRIFREYGAEERILFVNGFISQAELRAYLSAADYAISTPKTDQLSSSILEALACGVLPILSKNDAYEPVASMSVQYSLDCDGDFDKIFANYLNYGTGWEVRAKRINEVCLNFSKSAALKRVGILYGIEKA